MGSKKKKRQQKSLENRGNGTTAAAQEVKKSLPDTQTTSETLAATSDVKEVPEVQEIQVVRENSNVSEACPPKKQRRVSVLGILFGLLMTAAVVCLAVCLYKTSASLQSVQAFSGGLQTKLKNTEDKLNELTQSINEVRLDSQKSNATEAEEGEEPSATKKPYPTPVPDRYTVCIDAGHGAHDTGAVLETEDGTKRQEKDDNLWLAKLVQKELEAYGVKVVMTREDDSFLELYDRTLMANSLDADALISFHRNAYYLNGKMNDRVSGVEIWIHSSRPTSSRQLANRMLDAILEVGGMEDRGVRYGSMTDFTEDYAINRRALMTSMIVEMGFISNEGDNEAFDTNGEAYAKAIAKEIYEWLTK